MPGPSVRREVLRISEGGRRRSFDSVVVEEPLEIRVGGRPLAVTMRTPGHDFELTAGFLLAEGVLERADQLLAMRYCVDGATERQNYNVVDVEVRGGTARAAAAARSIVTTSSCGLCGRSSIDAVRARATLDVSADPLRIPVELLVSLPGRLRESQRLFERTGGLHAAGLFDATGELVCAREDVGRHNAFDKVIGWAALSGRLPLRSHVMLASGRASFELVQKALLAGVPALAAVSAPSSLAVELATDAGMTLVGFLRERTMNVYAGAFRLPIV